MSHRTLRANRDFTSLWIGQVVSELGSRISLFVFPLLAFAITGSALQAALVEALYLGGTLAALLPSGVLADRYDRGRLMRVSSGCGAVLYAGLGTWILLGDVHLAALCGVAFATGVVGGLFTPAEMSALNDVVPESDMPAAISQQSARDYLADLLGAPIGGVLYSISRAAPFLADAVTYAFSWVMLGRIRTDLGPRPVEGEPTSPRRDLVDGFKYVSRHPFLRMNVIWAALNNLSANILVFVCILHLIQDKVPPIQIALVDTALGVLGIAGAAAAPAVIERMRTGRLAILVAWSFLPLIVVLTRWDGPIGVIVALSIGCILNPMGIAGVGSYRMAITPPELLGRIQSTVRFVGMSLMPLAPIVAGFALHQWGSNGALAVAAVCIALTALIPTLAPSLRNIPRPSDWRAGSRPELAA